MNKFCCVLAFCIMSVSSATHAFSGFSGTCLNTGVPPAGGQMPGRQVLSGANSRFAITIAPTEVEPGAAHTITIARTSGSGGFRGLLLYVEDAATPIARIGTLAAIGGATTQGLTCSPNINPTSTLTHSATSSFTATQQFTWIAPASIEGPVVVKAIAYEAGSTWNVPTPLVVTVTPPGFARNDLNADGKADLLWRNATTGSNTVWFMDGTEKTPLGLTRVTNADWQIKAIADTDGDNRSDIIWRNETDGRNQIWRMIEGGKQTGSIATISDLDWEVAGADDFDGDGDDDVLWRHSIDGRNTIYFMDGFNATSTSITSISNLNWTVAGTGDLNADDKADILWRNQSTGANVVWLMDGASNTSSSLTTIADLDWQVQGMGDLNNDGFEDVVWRNATTRAVDAWLIGAGLTIDQQNIAGTSGSNFQIEMLGDTSGDMNADIIWRDQVNGTNIIWEMDGAVRTPKSIQKVGDVNWSIMP